MIHHYVNLVCWRFLEENFQAERDHVWIDSVSLRLSARLFRSDIAYRPGTVFFAELFGEAKTLEHWVFLTARPLSRLPRDQQVELPIFDKPYVPENVESTIMQLPKGAKIGIGISSPKQNELAVQLFGLRPDLEYHCLGAAISDEFIGGLSGKKSMVAVDLSGSGFEWLKFLVVNPSRTIKKIGSTVEEFFRIIFHSPTRSRFRNFVLRCLHSGSV